MSEFLSARKLSFGVAAGVGSILLSACGDGGYDTTIRPCPEGESSGVEATIESQDMNDPSIILSYAKDNRYMDDTTSSGINRWSGDLINGLGEITCEDGESGELVFNLQGLEVRQDYLADNSETTQE